MIGRHLLVDLRRNLPLKRGDFFLTLQQFQNFGHALGQRQRFKYFLQLIAACGRQRSGEVGQQTGLVGVELPDMLLKFLAIQGVKG